MSTGSGLMARIKLAVGGLPGVRLFRNNVGVGWVGQVTRRTDGSVIIRNPRPLHAGLFKGSGDLIGWVEYEIRPEDVGRTVAIFASIEVKDGSGRTDADQENWRRRVAESGGLAGVARSEEDALRIVGRGK